MKQCNSCSSLKPSDEFYPRRRTCKPCVNRRNLRDRKEYQKEYRDKNRDSLNQKRRIYVATNVSFRIGLRLRTRLYEALKGRVKNGSAVKDLGCSLEDLKRHLESKFKEGMNWSNWGIGPGTWQIDHIKELRSFNLEERSQILEACHYTNLQPIWFEDHIKKTGSYGRD